MIEVHGVRKSIRNGNRTVDILKGIDLVIPSGEFVAIMGASGSGKSTLLGLLAGLDAPTSGSVLLDGVDISHLSEDKLAEIRGKKLGFVFQSYQLIPTLTALENVLLPYELNAHGDGKPQARLLLESCRTWRTHAALSRAALGRRTAARGPGKGLHARSTDRAGRRANRQP